VDSLNGNRLKKWKIVFITVVVIAMAVTYLVYLNSYREFKPVTYRDDSFQYFEVENQNLFNSNLEIVLEYNGIDYRIDKYGAILIQRKVFKDKELLSNFTKKAMDSVWMNSHINSTL
jgi:hypothetical protein